MSIDEAAMSALYEELIAGWNGHDGEAFAAPFAPDGAVIGFDGPRRGACDRLAPAARSCARSSG
jgi:uncharacterized protein (TIGR02246 family)